MRLAASYAIVTSPEPSRVRLPATSYSTEPNVIRFVVPPKCPELLGIGHAAPLSQ